MANDVKFLYVIAFFVPHQHVRKKLTIYLIISRNVFSLKHKILTQFLSFQFHDQNIKTAKFKKQFSKNKKCLQTIHQSPSPTQQ
jgi:hypothetical protein